MYYRHLIFLLPYCRGSSQLFCADSRVRITFSCSNLDDMANSIIEISEVGVELRDCRVTVHLHVGQQAYVWRNGFARYLLAEHWVNFRVLAGQLHP